MRLFRPNVSKLEQRGDVRRLSAALKDNEASIREAAAAALDRIGLPDDPVVRAWHAVTRKDWPAAGALGEAAVEPLCSCLRDPDATVRNAAAEALGRIGQPAVGQLIRLLKDGMREEEARKAAARALVMIGEPAIGSLCALLDEPREIGLSAQFAAASALAAIGAAAVEPLGRKLLQHRDARAAPIALALGEVGDPRGIPFLAAALKCDWFRREWDYSLPVRQAAVEALAKIGTADAVEPLLYALCETASDGNAWLLKGDESPDVRRAATEALGGLRDPRAIPAVYLQLADESEELQHAARDALISIGARAAAFLHQQLEQTSPTLRAGIRAACVGILGQIKDPGSLPALVKALGDRDGGLREAAGQAIAEFGELALEPLRAAASDPDRRLAKAAGKALARIMSAPR